jgi:O-antigen ligase
VYAKNGAVTFVGVCGQKNSFGEMLMVLSLFLIWDLLEERWAGAKRVRSRMPWDHLVLLLMGAWLLTLSQSKTSLVCLLIGLALIFGRRWLDSRKTSGMVLLVALCLPFLSLTPQFRSMTAPMLEPLGRDATFTGRSDIWEHITSTTVNPLIGTGFYTFWGGPGGDAIREAMRTEVPNAHNGYLDLYLDGGWIGLALLLCLLLASGRRLIRNLDVNRYQQVRFAFLIVAIVANLTESNWGRPCAIWFTTVLVLLEFPFLKANETLSHEQQESNNSSVVVEVTT